VTELATCLAFADIEIGAKAVIDFSVTDADMRHFAALSGDYNDLHVDDAFARAKGFPGRVVYGALLVAKVSRLIGMKLPGRDSVWSALNLTFNNPLFVGETATVEGVVSHLSEAARLISLQITIRTDTKKLAAGKAQVVLVP
jgi:acyl dehydratase